MILADRDDYEYPSIDWCCKECGEVYVSRGYPDESRCTEGHAAGWEPRLDDRKAYAELLAGVEVGDGLVVCGEGPAPLKGVVAAVEIDAANIVAQFEQMDAPARQVRAQRPAAENETDGDWQIEWCQADSDGAWWQDVHHIERTDASEIRPAPDAEEEITALTGNPPTDGEDVFEVSIRSERRDGEWQFVVDNPFHETQDEHGEELVDDSFTGLLWQLREATPALEVAYATDGGDA